MSEPRRPGGLWSDSRDSAETQALYDDWAKRYDADMDASGMVGTLRLAEMLARVLPNRDALVWDFGCGTGLGGAAMAEAGFTNLEGTDISSGMLEQARAKGIYRALHLADPEAPPVIPDAAAAVTACGSICVGAAPAPVLDQA
ncbi:MAG: methyltransferase domain-containing protein, partial [Jannaschia sp.]